MGSGSSKGKSSVNKTNNSGSSPDGSARQTTAVNQQPPPENKLTNKQVESQLQQKPVSPAKDKSQETQTSKVEEAASSKSKDTSQEPKLATSEKPVLPDIKGTSAEAMASKVKQDVKETPKGQQGKTGKEDRQSTNVEEKVIDEGPKEQLKFDNALRSSCLLVSILNAIFTVF